MLQTMADYCYQKPVQSIILKCLFTFSPHGGHSTAGDFDSEVDSAVSSRRGSRRREKHINRNEGKHSKYYHQAVLYSNKDYEPKCVLLHTCMHNIL